jgi:hypothetical protein
MNSSGTFDHQGLFGKLSYDFRSCFYLLTPNETYYEKESEVPHLIDKVLFQDSICY